MGNAGRPLKLTDELKREINRIRLKHKNQWKAPDIRDGLRLFLEDKVKEEFNKGGLNWDNTLIREEAEMLLPGLSSIQKYLKKTKPNYDKNRREDDLWSLATLTDASIPPEALLHVVEAWVYNREVRKGGFFTIREAKWISRLYLTFKDDQEKLVRVALFYAEEELVNEVAGVSFWVGQPEGILNLYREFTGVILTDERRDLILGKNEIISGNYRPQSTAERKYQHVEKIAEANKFYKGRKLKVQRKGSNERPHSQAI